jgi:membrane fusion protein (multidrug efflux system)
MRFLTIVMSKSIVVILGLIILVVAGYFGVKHLRFSLAHEETDDAQVEGDISPVLPRVSGYVVKVLVKDNDPVEAGQPLLEIDAREVDLKIANASAAQQSAEASLGTAEASVEKARAALAVAEASIQIADVRNKKALDDLKRDTALFQTNAIADRQLSDTRAAADVGRTQLASVQRQAEAARADVAVAKAQVTAAQSIVKVRAADVAFAQLQHSYTTVTAPIAGTVSRKTVEPGQYVQAGQTLLSIASVHDLWVIANYKETQMAHIKVGQPVVLKVDAYSGEEFRGQVQSISAATGARFALLPPDNASGNYIKVTQRVPVKILVQNQPPDRPLRAGLSVDAAVLVKP